MYALRCASSLGNVVFFGAEDYVANKVATLKFFLSTFCGVVTPSKRMGRSSGKVRRFLNAWNFFFFLAVGRVG